MSQNHFFKVTSLSLSRLFFIAASLTLLMMGTACSPNELEDIVNSSVSGNVTGLNDGNTITLQNNNGDDIEITANGPFEFPADLGITNRYEVTVLAQPADQTCSVFNASGVISVAEITDVMVECEDN